MSRNRLAVLALEIRTEHEAVQRTGMQLAEHAYRAGERLAEAKANPDIPHGGWRRWVEEQAGIPLATADHYVSLFRAVEKRLLTLGDIAEAGQIGALRAAAQEISHAAIATDFGSEKHGYRKSTDRERLRPSGDPTLRCRTVQSRSTSICCRAWATGPIGSLARSQ